MKTGLAATVHVTADELYDVCVRALTCHGAVGADAESQAAQLVEGELRGHTSHGLLRLPTLTARLDAGLIVSGVEPDCQWRAPAALAVDGNLGFGPAVAGRALDLLIPRAAETGVAVAAIRRSHHLGMLAPYVERVAEAGAIGLILTTSEGLVHPWGGAGALVGTNPIAIGVPCGDGAVALDMSTGAVSAGKLIDYALRGESIPHGWAVDADGRQTTDATAAIDGAISPFGGARGYALGVTFEVLVGIMTSTAFGDEVHGTLDTDKPVSKGDVIVVISLAAFGADPASPDLARYVDQLRASGVDGNTVTIPGDRARRDRARRLTDGIAVDVQSWATARALIEGGALT